MRDVVSCETAADDGLSRGLLNWFVVGRARSPRGVRLNTGGSAHVAIRTAGGERFEVVLDTAEQAERVAVAIRAAAAG